MSSSDDPSAPRSVLIVMPRWVRDGGVGAHLMRSAVALAQEGLRVSVLVARIESDERFEGVELHHSPQLYKTDAMEPRFGAALGDEPDVVHLNQLDDPAVVDHLRERAAVVISAHGYLACASGVHYFRPGQGCERAHGPGCLPNLLIRGCAHRWDVRAYPADYRQAGRALEALRRADLVVGYSHAMERHLRAAGLERRRVVPYFPTLDVAPAADEPARRKVVFAGRLVAPKGGATLLRAVRDLEAEVVVCGEGPDRPRLERLASRLGIADAVQFRGWLHAHELAGELAQASLVAMPSLWPEPFGLVGIEGFAARRPAVASAVGGIPEWLEHGRSGLTAPAGDAGALAAALRELLDDPERRRAMGAEGEAIVAARYSRRAHLDAVTAAYADARERWMAARDGARSPARDSAA
jgi:glycosyltransferase involved in cell wall biosynthesis